MAITTVSATYPVGTAPTKTGQTLIKGQSDQQSDVYRGWVQATGDVAASTSFTVNFIDGTQAIAFTPSLILVFRSLPAPTATPAPGSAPAAADTAAATVQAVSATVVDNKTFTITLSAALGNGSTGTFGFIALK